MVGLGVQRRRKYSVAADKERVRIDATSKGTALRTHRQCGDKIVGDRVKKP
jgi:hypothetical protein